MIDTRTLAKRINRAVGKGGWLALVYALENLRVTPGKTLTSKHKRKLAELRVIVRSKTSRKQRLRRNRLHRRNQCPLAWAA